MSQEKISAAQAAQVYAEVPSVLRALSAERDSLQTKLAAAEHQITEFKTRDRIEKIAHKMEEKHLDVGTSFDDRVERIKQATVTGRSLDVIEEAVDMTAPQGGLGKLGSATEPGNGDSGTELVSYLLGGLGE